MRRLIALLVSATLIVLLYRSVNLSAMLAAMRSANPALLALGIGVIVPLMVATAWRFSILTGSARIGLIVSLELILMASSLNIALPSKMGDLAKSVALADRTGMDIKLALSICILEKVLDFVSLLVLGGVALFYVSASSPVLWALAAMIGLMLLILIVMLLPFDLLPRMVNFMGRYFSGRLFTTLQQFTETWQTVVVWFWSDTPRAIAVIVLSVALWAGHLMQFWLFALAIGAAIPLIDNMAFATLGILAGLLPFTAGGIGTRDWALVHFYSGYLSPAQGALLGVLATLRYLIPAIAGLPFLNQSIVRFHAVRNARRAEEQSEQQ